MVSHHQWFAVRSKTGREMYARENLIRQGFVTYLPLVRRWRSHARKRTRVSRAFFDGYLFLYLSPQQQNWVAINSTYGVIGAVRFGDFYPPVPDIIIEELRRREDDAGHIVLEPDAEVPFKKGERVAVYKGDAIVEGLFQKMSGEDRAIVLIDILKRQVPVRVPVDSLSPYNM